MKFAIAIIAAIASVSAVKLNDPRFPDVTNNWATDPLHGFDDSHFANNKVNSIFPEHVNIPVKATIWS